MSAEVTITITRRKRVRPAAPERPAATPDAGGWLRPADACAYLGRISRDTLIALEADGLLRPFRRGKVVLYERRQLDAALRGDR